VRVLTVTSDMSGRVLDLIDRRTLPVTRLHLKGIALRHALARFFCPAAVLFDILMSDEVNCGSGGGADDLRGLRIASVFVILIGSGCGALFPVLAKRSSWLHVPTPVFEYAR
jgi:hypothetical protein